MYVVTGATGKLGRLVIESLRKKVPAHEIVAGARDPARAADIAASGVTVATLDYDRPETLRDAFGAGDRVLLVSASDWGHRVRQHRAVIEAAARSQVALLAYTSILHADSSGMLLASDHNDTEKAIIESGVPYVLLRNGWYVENYTEALDQMLASGVVAGCADDGRIAAATRADLAMAAATVLTGEGHAGATYELAGVPFTLADLAAQLSRRSGRAVAHANMSAERYRATLVEAGLPDEVAVVLADSDRGIARGELDAPSDQLVRLLGRPPATMAEAVAAALHGPTGPATPAGPGRSDT